MSNWIGVNDRLPEQTTPVIIWTSVSIFAAMGLYCGDTWIYATVSTNFLTKNEPHVKVLYWQPLPERPQTNEQ